MLYKDSNPIEDTITLMERLEAIPVLYSSPITDVPLVDMLEGAESVEGFVTERLTARYPSTIPQGATYYDDSGVPHVNDKERHLVYVEEESFFYGDKRIGGSSQNLVYGPNKNNKLMAIAKGKVKCGETAAYDVYDECIDFYLPLGTYSIFSRSHQTATYVWEEGTYIAWGWGSPYGASHTVSGVYIAPGFLSAAEILYDPDDFCFQQWGYPSTDNCLLLPFRGARDTIKAGYSTYYNEDVWTEKREAIVNEWYIKRPLVAMESDGPDLASRVGSWCAGAGSQNEMETNILARVGGQPGVYTEYQHTYTPYYSSAYIVGDDPGVEGRKHRWFPYEGEGDAKTGKPKPTINLKGKGEPVLIPVIQIIETIETLLNAETVNPRPRNLNKRRARRR